MAKAMDSVDFSMAEVLRQAKSLRAAGKAKSPKSSKGQTATDVFPELLDVLGIWKLKSMPSVEIRIVKLNQLDKRSMSALFRPELHSVNGHVFDAGTPAPAALFQDADDDEVKLNLSLSSVSSLLDLSAEAEESAAYLLGLFDKMVLAAVKRGEKKGSLETYNFEANLKAVKRFMRNSK